MVEKQLNKHQKTPNLSGYQALDLDQTDIIVPSKLEQSDVQVQVGGLAKTVETKSEVKVGEENVQSPSVKEMKEFLEKNYDVIKKFDKEKLIVMLKEHASKIKALQKELIKKEQLLERIPKPEGKQAVQVKIDQMKKDLEGIEKALEKTKTNISSKGRFYQTREIFTQLSVALGTAVVVGGVSAFAISFDQNYAKYHNGKMTAIDFYCELAKDTAKGAAVSGGVAVAVSGGSMVAKYMATSSSPSIRLTGSFLGKALGPGIMVVAIGFQVIFETCWLF